MDIFIDPSALRVLLAILVVVTIVSLVGWYRSGRGFGSADMRIDARVVPDRLCVQRIRVGSTDRNYVIYLPPSYLPSRRLPLVIVLHGGGGTSMGIAQSSQMHRLARREGFIVVYPHGSGPRQSRGRTWNAGGFPPSGWAEKAKIDDVRFIRTLVEKLNRDFGVDERRIYVAGMSKGGMLAYHLACCVSETFAAAAVVAATMTTEHCRPKESVALLHIHGSKDENVPVEGGRGRLTSRGVEWPPVMRGLATWQEFNRCSSAPEVVYDTGGVRCVRFPSPDTGADVELCIIAEGGHGWPGAPRGRHRALGEYITRDFLASEWIWKFFKAHPKPQDAVVGRARTPRHH